jgi:hypothetical protein
MLRGYGDQDAYVTNTDAAALTLFALAVLKDRLLAYAAGKRHGN